MSKLEMVKLASRTNAYGQQEFDVVTIDGGNVCRSGIGGGFAYETALSIAQRIDAKMLYERENGVGSLDTL